MGLLIVVFVLGLILFAAGDSDVNITGVPPSGYRPFKEGTEVAWLCEASHVAVGSRLMLKHWLNGTVVESKRSESNESMELWHNFTLDRRHNGVRFMCSLQQGGEAHNSYQAYYRVLFPPRDKTLTASPEGRVISGSTLRVTCKVSSCNPPASIQFEPYDRDGFRLHGQQNLKGENQGMKVERTLEIKTMADMDRLQIICLISYRQDNMTTMKNISKLYTLEIMDSSIVAGSVAGALILVLLVIFALLLTYRLELLCFKQTRKAEYSTEPADVHENKQDLVEDPSGICPVTSTKPDSRVGGPQPDSVKDFPSASASSVSETKAGKPVDVNQIDSTKDCSSSSPVSETTAGKPVYVNQPNSTKDSSSSFPVSETTASRPVYVNQKSTQSTGYTHLTQRQVSSDGYASLPTNGRSVSAESDHYDKPKISYSLSADRLQSADFPHYDQPRINYSQHPGLEQAVDRQHGREEDDDIRSSHKYANVAGAENDYLEATPGSPVHKYLQLL